MPERIRRHRGPDLSWHPRRCRTRAFVEAIIVVPFGDESADCQINDVLIYSSSHGPHACSSRPAVLA